MIITVVCDVLGKENNGTTIAAMNLIRHLKKRGHEARVLCPDQDRKDDPGFYVVKNFNLGPLNGYVKKNGVSLSKPDRKTILKAIDGADVVHVMIPFALGVKAAKLACKAGIPVTAGFHTQAENFSNHIFMMNWKFFNTMVYRVFYRNLYRRCRCIHYPTEFICNVFENIVGPTNHYIISNGVSGDFRKKEPRELDFIDRNKYNILFTGRYSKEKSHKVLIDAVARSKHKEEIQLIFAGMGPQYDKIVKRSEKNGINRPVMQFFSHDDLVNVINSCYLYVHPAEIEIEAIACLEAISCGLVPVISDSERSATGKFALRKENLFRCNDPDDLASKIDYWIDSPDEMKKCSEEYSGYSEKYSFENCMDRMEAMIKDAAEKE